MNGFAPGRRGAIGDYLPMLDGPDKVSGRAKYTADVVQPGMLTGRIYRSPYAHAEIIEVDCSEAAKLPGVVAIITGKDCAQTFGVLPIARSEHPLARDKVRYKGEPVAAVAAIAARFCSSQPDDLPQIIQKQEIVRDRVHSRTAVDCQIDDRGRTT